MAVDDFHGPRAQDVHELRDLQKSNKGRGVQRQSRCLAWEVRVLQFQTHRLSLNRKRDSVGRLVMQIERGRRIALDPSVKP
jgi:hypothetical protein